MSSSQRKQRSSLSVKRNPAAAPSTSTARSSGRQTKVASQGFHYGDGKRNERDVERAERELARDRKRREQRLEELERGHAPSSSWNDSSSLHLPAASTSAAAIAGLLAGRQAEQEEVFDDGGLSKKVDTASSKRKQSADLKRLLTQRRSLKLLLEDAASSPIVRSAPNSFVQSLQVAPRYPLHRSTGAVCSICGYWGDIRCTRCHERICGLQCATTHNETRCERPM